MIETIHDEPPWTVDRFIEHLVAARRGGALVPAERATSAVRSGDDAYRIQGRVGALLWPDVEAVAWKAGADSRESLPVAAPMMPSLVFENGATLPSASFPVRIVEAEIAFRFAADLPPRELPYSSDEVLAAVATMHAAIEVVTPRIADHAAASPLAKLADHQVNGAFVLGDGIAAWRKVDLRRQSVRLSFDGKLHEAATGSHALGNPAVLLPWFVAHLGRLPVYDADGNAHAPRGVKAGDVVTTGSWTKIVEAKAKQRVDVEFPGIGKASLTFS
jgi:2-keto-4-pentenoate hydratase